jgi:hypothetical protein
MMVHRAKIVLASVRDLLRPTNQLRPQLDEVARLLDELATENRVLYKANQRLGGALDQARGVKP